MTINGMRFLFADQTSDEFGVILCDIGSINTDSNDEASNLITTTNPFKDSWDFHYKNKSEPLQFTITIAKTDGTYFDAFEERFIKKWLCKGKREWLQIDQNDLNNVFYYCHLINPKKVDVGRRNAGLQFSVVCDCGYAWTELNKKNYSSTTTYSFNFNGTFDFDNYVLYPTLILTSLSNGNIGIKNITTNEEIIVNNCTTSEVIYLNCKTDKIKSSNGRVLIDNWNKKTISLKEGNNQIVMSGNFTMQMQYRLPVRVGG